METHGASKKTDDAKSAKKKKKRAAQRPTPMFYDRKRNFEQNIIIL